MLFFISGLLLFLLGLEGSKKSIKYAVSDNIEKIIKNITNSIFLSLLIGIIITALIQSSSAVSILAISLIEAGILSLRSAIALIMGANIGTTITVQIISLPIISNYPVIIILALIIISIAFLFKNEKIFFSGLAILSFGIVFMGLNIMITYFQKPEITIIIKNILFYSRNSNILGVILGMVVTAIIQSSSAVTAITIGLAYNNLITLHSAVAIALGSNIGTCITAYIASFSCSKLSKAMSHGHFIFNLVGVILILLVYNNFVELIMYTEDNLLRQIANAHTIFNIFNVLIFLPFINTFVSFLGGEKNEFN